MKLFNEIRDDAKAALGENIKSGNLDCEALAKSGVKVWLTDSGRSSSGKKERADCTVRAVSACLGIEYVEAHTKLESLGRKPRSGFKLSKCLTALGLEQRPELSCRTLEAILPQMQAGKFIVRVTRHVFAVVNGVIVDMAAPKLKSRVKMVYERATP